MAWPMKQCPNCLEMYNWEKNSTACPHIGFPRTQRCEAHDRNNCGDPVCEAKLMQPVNTLTLTGPKRKVG
jgi:hypothetical protein